MSVWDNKELLEIFEADREDQRKEVNRLSFDCYNCKVRGERVYCVDGKFLNRYRSSKAISLVEVLQGGTAHPCILCDKFSGGD